MVSIKIKVKVKLKWKNISYKEFGLPFLQL